MWPDEPTVDAADLHHASHDQLLRDEPLPDGTPAARLDAIVVPTAWPVDALRHVMQVGTEIDCPVVVLCSRAASAEQARNLADEVKASVLAVDVDQSLSRLLPTFATDQLLRESGFGSPSDLSLKRNLGLVLARGSSWRRVMFLDDDIHIDDSAQLDHAAGLVDRYRAVGLANHGYADNSVVCHAYRAVRGPQKTFIGGGAMIVDATRTRSFYPNIYNEDWLFLLGDGVPFTAARAGVMRQRPYDPFANPARAAVEEFGDTLAEGLFWLLDGGKRIDTTNSGFWADALFRRREFIDLVIGRLEDSPEHERIRRSLQSALGRSADIKNWLCQAFVERWQADLERWRTFLEWELPVTSGPEKFLHEVNLSGRVLASTAYKPRVMCGAEPA